MLTPITADGTAFTGVQYETVETRHIAHHKQYGHRLLWIERVVALDAEGNPVETPTADDLANEVTEADTPETRLAEIERALGGSGSGQRGIAARLDSIEDRLAALEGNI